MDRSMDKYVYEEKIIDKTEEEKEIDLLVSIYKAKKELDEANHNFEYAEGDLIDYYTYKMKATSAKLDYFLKKAKKMGLEISMVDQIDIRFNRAI